MQETNEETGEGTHLIRRHVDPTPTPLPVRQLCGLLPQLVVEPMISSSIAPYINELVSELEITGGDKRKAGYYAGIIISLYFVGEATTVLQWGRLSDSIGRKPILLSGTLGILMATTLFGLSRSFWSLALSRFLAGALNGNIGVIKTTLTEMTDETNVQQSFSLIPLTWAMGLVLGSSAGGLLSRPHDHWPQLFSNPFWTEFPYFFPCAATSACAMASLVITHVFLRETLHGERQDAQGEENPDHPLEPDEERNAEPPSDSPVGDQQDPEPPHSLLTMPVVLTISVYATHAFLEISDYALVPLVYTTPIRLGGLGLEPIRMGTCLTVFGIITGIVPFFFFDRIVNFLGRRRALVTFMSGLVPAFLLFPINGTRARHVGMDVVTWVLVFLHLFLMVGINMTYGVIFVYIKSAAPEGMLGATNGLAQTVVSIQRAIGPALTASLFSFSLENNIMGGYGVFYALALCTLAALWLALRLPPNMWNPRNG